MIMYWAVGTVTCWFIPSAIPALLHNRTSLWVSFLCFHLSQRVYKNIFLCFLQQKQNREIFARSILQSDKNDQKPQRFPVSQHQLQAPINPANSLPCRLQYMPWCSEFMTVSGVKSARDRQQRSAIRFIHTWWVSLRRSARRCAYSSCGPRSAPSGCRQTDRSCTCTASRPCDATCDVWIRSSQQTCSRISYTCSISNHPCHTYLTRRATINYCKSHIHCTEL